jgi:hypothetical protein
MGHSVVNSTFKQHGSVVEPHTVVGLLRHEVLDEIYQSILDDFSTIKILLLFHCPVKFSIRYVLAIHVQN